ncbi:MAG TPA: arginine--tRNA ligase [Firmicutes bacterium]|nr:arginine--tRNA ligase [Bacillota bacterium]
MDFVINIKQKVLQALQKIGVSLKLEDIVIETSKDPLHGEYATNVAMQLARTLKTAPQTIAEKIVANLDPDVFSKVEIAGPGFINFFMKPEDLSDIIQKIIHAGKKYGSSDIGKGQTVNVEFVSANPTGALHLGHARGAALGDVIARLLQKAGFKVTKEFYVNDAGAQIDNLGKSIYARYLQAFDVSSDLPKDGYYGADIIEIAQSIKEEVGAKYVSSYDEAFFKAQGIKRELQRIRMDLEYFRVNFDVYSHETSIRTTDKIKRVFEKLGPYVYQQNGATFLKTSTFGDDKDRVVIKSDGSYTYFLPDIVYHLDKAERNHRYLIDILGADHHGYISRMQAALSMLGFPSDTLTVEILQMVRLIKDGQELKMSKRTGVGVTLRELCDEVGVDATRYFFVARAASSHLDFDMDLAVTTSNANPVYYAQYAHARLSSLLSAGADIGIDEAGIGLSTDEEKLLLRHLASFGSEISDAAISKAPYKITNYVQKLATLTHSFYTICRVVDKENISLSQARLGLVKASQIVLANALELLGVSAPTRM